MEYIVNHKKGDHNNIKVKFNKFFYIALLFSFLQEILSALSTIAFIVIGINGFATNIFLI
ncbi:hypothetical protein FACS189459_1570 [Bacilli bacterium]|nr:hypothetical protein FACS189459_1570 [Bacilli bacterium]